ncbi:MAG: IPT/TIG domain-containing protein, partial [Planctomycetaceae bacterium]|nr:IPT/TIG domain-containing protein [Planctomycetaceae bacterium]
MDLAGGDLVTVTGTGFLTAAVDVVSFGGVPGTNRILVSETELTVVTPAAPGGVPGAVTVTFTSLSGGTVQVPLGYTYASSAPA